MATRQITDLPVASDADDNDLMIIRQGTFDKQVQVSLIRAAGLLAENNLSDLDDVAAARSNLGVSATGDVLLVSNNLSDLSNTVTARTNLGVPAEADVLLEANNLSDLDNATTAVSNLGLPAASTIVINDGANDYNFNVQEKPQLKNYSETLAAQGNITGTHSFDLTNGNIQSATVTGDVTISFTNPPASGQVGTLTIFLTDGGDHTITWPGSVLWPGGSAPSLTSGGTDLLVFTTFDNGTNWYGALGGANFS